MHCEMCGKFAERMAVVDDTWLCQRHAFLMETLLGIAHGVVEDAERRVRAVDVFDDDALIEKFWEVVKCVANDVPFAETVTKVALTDNPLTARD